MRWEKITIRSLFTVGLAAGCVACSACGMDSADTSKHTGSMISVFSETEGEAMTSFQELIHCSSEQEEKIKQTVYEETGGYPETIQLEEERGNGYLVSVTADKTAYYLKINFVYRVNEIREDSADGEVIYQVNY